MTSMKNKQYAIEVLLADNGNQEAFVASVRAFAGVTNVIFLMLQRNNRQRAVNMSADLGPNGVLARVKVEPGADAAADGEDAERADGADEALINEELDDVETVLMGSVWVFLGVDGKDETPEARGKRFSLWHKILVATPNHRSKVALAEEGNIYKLMKSVLRQFRVTQLSHFRVIEDLVKLQFTSTMSVADLLRALDNLEFKSQRVAKGIITPALKKATFLQLCGKRKMFTDLVNEFSKLSCTLELSELMDELLEREDNTPENERGQRAMLLRDGGEEAAHYTKRKEAGAASSEVCRNFLRGFCKNKDCPRVHPEGQESSLPATQPRKATGKGPLCYKCRRYHNTLAKDCKNPPAPAKEQALEVEDFLGRARAVAGQAAYANVVREFKRPSSGASSELAAHALTKPEAAGARMLIDSGASSHFLFEENAKLSRDNQVTPDADCSILGAQVGTPSMQSQGRINADIPIKNATAPLRADSAALVREEEMREQLFSVGRATAAGYSFLFDQDYALVMKDGAQQATVRREDYLYPMLIQERTPRTSTRGQHLGPS
jgi:hypothetical protein